MGQSTVRIAAAVRPSRRRGDKDDRGGGCERTWTDVKGSASAPKNQILWKPTSPCGPLIWRRRQHAIQRWLPT